jgi:response regulator RpfG family c-di-GMP phosphodiesterase
VQREYETLNVLGKAAEYKDPETGAHIIRVGYYARMLAKLLNEDELSQDLIFYAAPLHDIGKIGVPDSILLKPGPLTPMEFETMKDHTRIGYEILRHAQSPYLHAGATIALTHHERYNGTGYPSSLAGENIPLYGRIVCLIDVFDALTSKRPYKEAWPLERAIDLLITERNVHFDPKIVDLFVASRSEVERIFNQYQEQEY